MVRYNRSPNPSCDVNTAGWVGFGATPSRVTGQTVGDTGKTTAAQVSVGTGAYSTALSCGGPAAASGGQTWSCLAWIRLSMTRSVECVAIRYNGDSVIGTAPSVSQTIPANTWTRVRFVTTTSGSFTNLRFHIDFPTSGTSGTMRVGAVRMEQVNDSGLDFADGDTPGWDWDGTPGSSTSTRPDTVAVPVDPARAASRVGTVTPGQTSAVGAGQLRAVTRGAVPGLGQHQGAVAADAARSTVRASAPIVVIRAFPVHARPARSSAPSTSPLPAQRHTVPVSAARASATATATGVTQRHTVVGRSLRSATGATAITIAGVRPLRSATRATRPALTQHGIVPAVHTARASPAFPAVAVGQLHLPLTVAAVVTATRTVVAALTQASLVPARPARGGTGGTSPRLGHVTAVPSAAVGALATAQRARIDQAVTLTVSPARTQRHFRRVYLGVLAPIALSAARATTRATPVAVAISAAEPALAPTDVRVDVAGYVAVVDRTGHVLETTT